MLAGGAVAGKAPWLGATGALGAKRRLFLVPLGGGQGEESFIRDYGLHPSSAARERP